MMYIARWLTLIPKYHTQYLGLDDAYSKMEYFDSRRQYNVSWILLWFSLIPIDHTMYLDTMYHEAYCKMFTLVLKDHKYLIYFIAHIEDGLL